MRMQNLSQKIASQDRPFLFFFFFFFCCCCCRIDDHLWRPICCYKNRDLIINQKPCWYLSSIPYTSAIVLCFYVLRDKCCEAAGSMFWYIGSNMKSSLLVLPVQDFLYVEFNIEITRSHWFVRFRVQHGDQLSHIVSWLIMLLHQWSLRLQRLILDFWWEIVCWASTPTPWKQQVASAWRLLNSGCQIPTSWANFW